MNLSQQQPASPNPEPEGPPAKNFGNEALGVIVLSGVAGYVDTAGCLTLFGMLTAHVTGSLVTAGALAAEHPKLGAMARLAMLPIFMITVALTALFVRRRKRRGLRRSWPLLALMTSALALFCATGVELQRFAMTPDAWGVGLIGATGVMADGRSRYTEAPTLAGSPPPPSMTGNLTQVTMDLVELVLPSPHHDHGCWRARARSESPSREVSVLAAGRRSWRRRVGAIVTHWVGLLSIAVPTVATLGLTIIAWRTSVSCARSGSVAPRLRGNAPTPTCALFAPSGARFACS